MRDGSLRSDEAEGGSLRSDEDGSLRSNEDGSLTLQRGTGRFAPTRTGRWRSNEDRVAGAPTRIGSLALQRGLVVLVLVIAQHVKAWGRDERTETADEIEGFEQDGMHAILPGALEPDAHATIVMPLELVERRRRARDVAAQMLEPRAVATIDRDLSLDIDATDLGEGAPSGRGDEAKGSDELLGLAPSASPEELHVGSRRAVAGGQHGLAVGKRIGRADALEAASVTLEHAQSHVHDVVVTEEAPNYRV